MSSPEPTHGRFQWLQLATVQQLLTVGINGFGPFKSAPDAAAEALAHHGGDRDAAVRALIRTHVSLAGAQGFAMNVGGFITMPVTVPTNVGAAFLIQSHLAASIACVYGHDPASTEVRTGVLVCLVGNAGMELVKKSGIEAGKRLTVSLINRVPAKVLARINQKVGFMLLAKFGGRRAAFTLAKGVPLVGGVIGAGFDFAATRAVGQLSKKFFAPGTPVVAQEHLEGELVLREIAGDGGG